MTDLGPDARSFRNDVRDADDPSSADAARIRARLALQLGAAATVGTAATLAARSTAARRVIEDAGYRSPKLVRQKHRFYDVAEMRRRLETHVHGYKHARTHHALGGMLVLARHVTPRNRSEISDW